MKETIYKEDAIYTIKNMLGIARNEKIVTKESAMYALRALSSAQPEPQWISVEDRLPEEDDMYLVTVHPRYIVPGGIQIDMLGWHEGKWNFQYFDGRDAVFPDPVIAWQPLPAPYREGET